ncbi:MAG TPA: hypothetical protein VIB39_10670 [Candidatus Angelobacter sp.]
MDDPEISFHRYFRTLTNPEHRAIYRGKADLDVLEPDLSSLLLKVQQSYNSALKERGSVFERGACSDFHLDYVDATIASAFSFEYEGRAFLALSIPLIAAMWRSAGQLCQSKSVMSYFQDGTGVDLRNVHAIFFLAQISFLVSHEFAHHDRGHFSSRSRAGDLDNDLEANHKFGSMAEQAKEIDADGWAVMLNVDNWFDRAGRGSFLHAFGQERAESHQADNQLLVCLVMSVCAALLLWQPMELTEANVYELSHPPQAARMERILLTIDMWARNSRPWIAMDATQHIFPDLISAVEDALAPVTGAHNWEQQVNFLRTSAGQQYMHALIEQSESIRRQ